MAHADSTTCKPRRTSPWASASIQHHDWEHHGLLTCKSLALLEHDCVRNGVHVLPNEGLEAIRFALVPV
jgi:hypothetical protein